MQQRDELEFKSVALDSIAYIVLVNYVVGTLGVERKTFPLFLRQVIDSMWEMVQEIDSTIDENEPLTKKTLASTQELAANLRHCCTIHHYSFQIKKCGTESCALCGPVRLQKEVFDQLHFRHTWR